MKKKKKENRVGDGMNKRETTTLTTNLLHVYHILYTYKIDILYIQDIYVLYNIYTRAYK